MKKPGATTVLGIGAVLLASVGVFKAVKAVRDAFAAVDWRVPEGAVHVPK